MSVLQNNRLVYNNKTRKTTIEFPSYSTHAVTPKLILSKGLGIGYLRLRGMCELYISRDVVQLGLKRRHQRNLTNQ